MPIFSLQRRWRLSTWTAPDSENPKDTLWWRVVQIGPVIVQFPYRDAA